MLRAESHLMRPWELSTSLLCSILTLCWEKPWNPQYPDQSLPLALLPTSCGHGKVSYFPGAWCLPCKVKISLFSACPLDGSGNLDG